MCIPLLLSGCWEKTGISCPDNFDVCDSACVDTRNDVNNCGGCGTTCNADQTCNNGTCVAACDTGLDLCDGACADLQSDPTHCGSCTNACAPGEVCALGDCAQFCPGDLTDCSGACVDTDTNRFNCGGCDDGAGSNTCAAGEICNAGACELSCGGTTPTLCGDACVNTDSDRNNCGGCDDGAGSNTCAADETCAMGACVDAFACGNGVLDPGEVCDDGNTLAGDGCSANCRSTEVCGNATLDASTGEACDDGNNIDGDGCQANCALPTCGDGIVDPFEVCDDGNNVSGDGCNATCTSPEICGNGILDASELCDDGNNVDGDGCQANCTLPTCGDGILDPGEVCDDGNTVSGDGTCNSTCTSNESCGNGILDVGEGCDDGNNTDGDGCQGDCTLPKCGDGVLDPGEVCDDGNNVSGDGTCNSTCTSDESCGNGILDVGEECDDGNLVAGDGCDANCQLDCIPPLSDCFGVCVNIDYDPNHCGGCGSPCAGTEACVAGICTPLDTGTNVLVLGDGDADATVDAVLTGAGYNVTVAPVIEYNYDGTNPSPAPFCAVVHLNGDTFSDGMLAAGQIALQNYVNAGGGFVGMEWNAYEELSGTMVNMPELILLVRSTGYSGYSITYSINAAGLTHPVTAGLPVTFTFNASGSYTTPKGGMGITVLGTDAFGNDAIAVRNYGSGRVVNHNHSGHFGTGTAFADPNAAQLLIQSVDWLCGP